MKKLAALALFSLLAYPVFAQRDFAKLVGGLEMAFDVSQLTDGFKPRFIPTFQMEVPIGSLAFGAGIGRKYYQNYTYAVDAGTTILREENGVPVTYYHSNVREFKPAYWTVPLKAELRVHKCQCVYAQVGVTVDFFDAGTPDRLVFSGAEYRNAWPAKLTHGELFKKHTTSFSLGIGFNLFRAGGFRLIARPSIVWSENPEVYQLYAIAPKFIPTLRMNFGVQYALIR